VAIICAFEIACRDGVSESEKRGCVSTALAESFEVESVFVVQHVLKSFTTNIAFALAINRVANGHVIRGHTLGYRASGPSDSKEPAYYLLARTDFRKGAIAVRVEVDGEGFTFSVWAFEIETFSGHVQ
jgi:hypothetical protein